MRKEIIEDYLKRSGDTQIFTQNLIENEHGFASFQITEEALVILNVYGDGKYWDDQLCQIANELGLAKVRFATRRNPKPFERKFNYKTIGYVMEKEI
jgi:hypothetical protein